MAGIRWNFSPARLFEWLGDVRRRQIEAGVRRVADRMAKEIEAHMRANAPWRDRTGNARRLLQAEVLDVTGRAALILLTHGVPYGIYLEARGYAIIGPTLDLYGPRIMQELQIELAGGTFGGV